MNAYYLCDKKNKVALSFGVLPQGWGTIVGMADLPYEMVSDLNWAHYPDHAFLTEAEALVMGISAQSIANQKQLAAQERWELIKQERDNRALNGGVNIGGKWFYTDPDSRTKYLGMMLLGQNLPTDIAWKTMDGTWQPVSPSYAALIVQSVAQFDSALMKIGEIKKAEVFASESPPTYSITANFPKTFLESVAS